VGQQQQQQQWHHLQLLRPGRLLLGWLPAHPAVRLVALLQQVLPELAPSAVRSCDSPKSLHGTHTNKHEGHMFAPPALHVWPAAPTCRKQQSHPRWRPAISQTTAKQKQNLTARHPTKAKVHANPDCRSAACTCTPGMPCKQSNHTATDKGSQCQVFTSTSRRATHVDPGQHCQLRQLPLPCQPPQGVQGRLSASAPAVPPHLAPAPPAAG
jgi:hypothetical protein